MCGAAGLICAPHAPQAEMLSRRLHRHALRALQQLTDHPLGMPDCCSPSLPRSSPLLLRQLYRTQKLMVAGDPVPCRWYILKRGQHGVSSPTEEAYVARRSQPTKSLTGDDDIMRNLSILE